MGKTGESSDTSNNTTADCPKPDDWLVFRMDSGTLYLRKSRHKVISGEDGELSIASIISQSGANLPPDIFASVDDTWVFLNRH